VELGFDPLGHKFQEGDGRTPEGEYIIDRRNPNSEFYLSIGIDYPNEADIAAAEEAGVDPGGDIFIHGTPRPFARDRRLDRGCIAVTNREMRQIYAMVQDGTPITIALTLGRIPVACRTHSRVDAARGTGARRPNGIGSRSSSVENQHHGEDGASTWNYWEFAACAWQIMAIPWTSGARTCGSVAYLTTLGASVTFAAGGRIAIDGIAV
jgi:hypothetical protein